MLWTLPVIVIAFALYYLWRPKKKALQPVPQVFPEPWRDILQDKVLFYANLDTHAQRLFEERMLFFLASTKITGIKTVVEDIDKVYIAAGAIIPICAFPDWQYNYLDEVLVYPNAFNKEFAIEGPDRTITGMVGTGGVMENIMILSQKALRHGFENTTDKKNVIVHEFIHLLDKEDATIDGIPKVLLEHAYTLPWMELIRKKIKEIHKEKSDINPYGGTSQTEFFAVASEYFFERPKLLQRKHPELYAVLVQLFQQEPKLK